MSWGSQLFSLGSPVGPGLKQGRTDQGVDYSGSGPLYAVESGTILSTTNSGWPGGTFIALALDNPPDALHHIVYYAEDITPGVSIGQHVDKGQLIGQATGGSSGIELGWGANAIGQPLNQAEHGLESGATVEGQNFLAAISGAAVPTNASGAGSGATGTGTGNAATGSTQLLNLPGGKGISLPSGIATRIVLAILGIIVLLIALNKLFDKGATAPEVITEGGQQATQQAQTVARKANEGRPKDAGPPMGKDKPPEKPKENTHRLREAA